ncbi:MAG: hypothetical protein R3D34_02840 [Nitratireductor sp.]
MMGFGRVGPLVSVVLAVMLVASGCAERPKEAPAIRTILPMEAVDPTITAEQALAAISDTAPAEDDGIHTVLALSAGGADGAYGAGVLTGWTRSGTRPIRCRNRSFHWGADGGSGLSRS